MLSAQATDVSVNKATEPLFKVADTPQKMLALGEERLKDYIKTIGLFNTKAKNVIALSRDPGRAIMAARCRKSREALQTLPGVGRKTANVVLNIAFGAADHRRRHPHLPRSATAPAWRPARRPTRSSRCSMKRVPEKYRLNAHHWLILHGRYVCKARKPDCAALRACRTSAPTRRRRSSWWSTAASSARR